MIEEGQPIPKFSLTDAEGRVWTEADLLGKKTILYFYPKDDTTGCTAQACSFRDALPRLGGYQVIGVSPDDEKSHAKFIKKYELSIPLLADTEQMLSKAMGVWVEKALYGRKYWGVERTTFLIDEKGRVRRILRKVKPQNHALFLLEEVLPAR